VVNNPIENLTCLPQSQVPGRLPVFRNKNLWISRGEAGRDLSGEVQGWPARWFR
jgi:hypothetical protein